MLNSVLINKFQEAIQKDLSNEINKQNLLSIISELQTTNLEIEDRKAILIALCASYKRQNYDLSTSVVCGLQQVIICMPGDVLTALLAIVESLGTNASKQLIQTLSDFKRLAPKNDIWLFLIEKDISATLSMLDFLLLDSNAYKDLIPFLKSILTNEKVIETIRDAIVIKMEGIERQKFINYIHQAPNSIIVQLLKCNKQLRECTKLQDILERSPKFGYSDKKVGESQESQQPQSASFQRDEALHKKHLTDLLVGFEGAMFSTDKAQYKENIDNNPNERSNNKLNA